MLFGPRWFFMLPVIVLAPLVLLNNSCKLFLPLTLGGLLVAWPLMGLNVSLPSSKANSSRVVRVLTSNTEEGSAQQRALDLAQSAAADIVALQEYREDKPLNIPKGWSMVRRGELAVISRHPLRELQYVKSIIPPHKYPRYCALQVAVTLQGGEIAFVAVHLPSPRNGLQQIMSRRAILDVSKAGLIQQETDHRRKVSGDVYQMVSSQRLPVIAAGDFNMPIESSIYREQWSRYANAFSKVGNGYGWTERNRFRGIPVAVRIDHIVTGNGLKPLLCETGPDIGSDHLPLIADIAL